MESIFDKIEIMLNRGGVLMISEAYFLNKHFERIEGYRIYNTFNHDYSSLLVDKLAVEYIKENNIFVCKLK